MAGGKQSARQKMINLMYLVFIAMLAMKMDKEVLQALGFMNDKVTESIEKTTELNNAGYAEMNQKVGEQSLKYTPLKTQTDQIKVLADDLYNYVDKLKVDLLINEKDKKDYESMDQTEALDAMFFEGGKRTARGEEFIAKMNAFSSGVSQTLGETNDLAIRTKKTFGTEDVVREGVTKGWLEHYYEGYPMVASLTNFTRIQDDVKTVEADALSMLMSGQLKSEVSMTKYEAIVIPEKTAFFSGENFKGKIVLGKVDPTLKPSSVEIGGRKIKDENIQAGQVLLQFPAGAVGERNIVGEFQFKEGDSIVKIPIKSSYAVVPKPNSAVIAADKMNVVYRNLPNPMTVSIPGIPDNLVRASASGLRKVSGVGKYMMTPGTGSTVKITASGKLPDGSNVSSSQTFRIKDIPKPLATVRKESGFVKMPKASLARTTVRVELPDFLFDLQFNVRSFKVKVPGKATITVSGSKMNGQAQSAINGARVGDVIAIFDVKSSLQGVTGVNVKDASAVSVEIQ